MNTFLELAIVVGLVLLIAILVYLVVHGINADDKETVLISNDPVKESSLSPSEFQMLMTKPFQFVISRQWDWMYYMPLYHSKDMAATGAGPIILGYIAVAHVVDLWINQSYWIAAFFIDQDNPTHGYTSLQTCTKLCYNNNGPSNGQQICDTLLNQFTWLNFTSSTNAMYEASMSHCKLQDSLRNVDEFYVLLSDHGTVLNQSNNWSGPPPATTPDMGIPATNLVVATAAAAATDWSVCNVTLNFRFDPSPFNLPAGVANFPKSCEGKTVPLISPFDASGNSNNTTYLSVLDCYGGNWKGTKRCHLILGMGSLANPGIFWDCAGGDAWTGGSIFPYMQFSGNYRKSQKRADLGAQIFPQEIAALNSNGNGEHPEFDFEAFEETFLDKLLDYFWEFLLCVSSAAQNPQSLLPSSSSSSSSPSSSVRKQTALGILQHSLLPRLLRFCNIRLDVGQASSDGTGGVLRRQANLPGNLAPMTPQEVVHLATLFKSFALKNIEKLKPLASLPVSVKDMADRTWLSIYLAYLTKDPAKDTVSNPAKGLYPKCQNGKQSVLPCLEYSCSAGPYL